MPLTNDQIDLIAGASPFVVTAIVLIILILKAPDILAKLIELWREWNVMTKMQQEVSIATSKTFIEAMDMMHEATKSALASKDATEARYQSLEIRVKSLEQQLIEKTQQLEEANKKIEELQKQLESVNTDRRKVQGERDALELKVKQLESDIHKLSIQLAEKANKSGDGKKASTKPVSTLQG